MTNILVTLIATGMMICLLTLTFHNDDALATVFHVNPFWWAMFVHIAIITLPPIKALLTDPEERRVAGWIWYFALFVALVGNIAGSLSHAAGVTFRQVLSHDFGTFGQTWGALWNGVLLSAIMGGALLVVFEGVVGWLWERSIARSAIVVSGWVVGFVGWYQARNNTPEPSPQKADKPRVVARPIPVPQIAPSPLVESPEPILAPWLETPKEVSTKPKRASKQAAVFEYLDNHPNAKHIEVSEACGVSVDLVRQYTARWHKRLKLVPAESVPVDIHVNGKNH